MARPLVVRLGDAEIALQLEKVDRSRLYGTVDVEAEDEAGRPCRLVTLAADGRSLLGSGSTALAFLSPDGRWLDRPALAPVDLEGKPIAPVPSSLAAPVPLEKKATAGDYLSHDVRAVYLLRPEGDAAALLAELRSGTIYTFPFSFRGGLEASVGFLLASADGSPFLAVGERTSLRFVGLEQAAVPAEEAPEGEEEGAEEEALDFGMM